MSTTFKQPGDYMPYTNTSGTEIPVNSIVVAGDQIGIATTTIPNNGTGELALSGVHVLPKVTGNAWVQGKKLLWDASAKKFDVGTATAAAGDVSNCCIAFRAAAAGDTTGWVKINVGIGTVT